MGYETVRRRGLNLRCCAVCGHTPLDSRQRAGNRTVTGPESLDVYAGGAHGDGHRWPRSQRDGVHTVRVIVGDHR